MIIALIALCLAFSGAPQQAATNSQSTTGIFGRVVSTETNEAVRRTFIKVLTPNAQLDEITDGDGRFRFLDLEPGDYTLIVHRDGFTDRIYKVERSDFVAQKELSVQLLPQGVIAGRIVDGLGQALQSATIEALASRTRGGQLEVVGSATSDDLGEYRLSGLNPGTYRLRATYRGGRESELDPTPLTIASSYYGGSEKPAEVPVKVGSLTSGIDFVLKPARPATVRGTLHTESGVFAERVTMWIMGRTGEGGHNADGEGGKFEISDVGPGTYTISAETQGLNSARLGNLAQLPNQNPELFRKMAEEARGSAALFGSTTVEVHGSDVDSVDILLRPVPKIEGEFRLEGTGAADLNLGAIYFNRTERITVMPMEMGQPDKDRRFSILLIPGEYTLGFDESITKLGVQSVTLDGKPIMNWKMRIDESPETRKLVIVLGGDKPR